MTARTAGACSEVSERLRLFVAFDLPAAVRSELVAWSERVAPAEARRVPAANLHLTLAFLGSRGADDARSAGALLAEVVRPVGRLRTAGALWLPPRRPGVLAVALEGPPQLSALRADLADALADAIGHVPERRAFRPHVTVARTPRGDRAVRNRPMPAPPALEFAPGALVLYRSRIGPEGSSYEPLARASASELL